ncbi:MAG: EVE domain-containing protein [Archangium sp.]|nr:EVE domain-containing protein [Archangium sp.]
MSFWLMKSEPDVFSIDDLKKARVTGWEGVRNFQARNYMRDSMKEGELVLFYHSNGDPSGVAGVAKVHGAPIPDPTQFQKKHEYYDATSPKDDPRWMMRQVEFVERFDAVIPLEVLKADPKLSGMPLLQKGQRLSVQTVTPAHFARVLELAKSKTQVVKKGVSPS